MVERSDHTLIERLERAKRRERALAAVLRLVAMDRIDLEAVLIGIAEQAAGLFDAPWAAVFVAENGEIGMYFHRTFDEPGVARQGRGGREMSSTSALTAVLRDRNVLRFDDQSAIGDEYAQSRDAARESGVKSAVFVPIPAGGLALGIWVSKRVVDPFTDDDVALLQAFAAQAASAVESTRRAAELGAANAELAESLELRTATSEILRLISDHPGDLREVFRGIVERAATLCDAAAGSAQQFVGDELEFVAHSTESGQRLVGTRAPTTLVADLRGPTYIDDIHEMRQTGTPARSVLSVPLMNGDELFGQLTVVRLEVRPFEPRHGRILQSFADQAAVAIANANLFNDLGAALERQTAMTDVLDAVSIARLDLQPVFDAVAEHAVRLCRGASVALFTADDDGLRLRSVDGAIQTWDDPGLPESEKKAARWPVAPTTPIGEAASTGRPVHVADWREVPAERWPDSRMQLSGMQTHLAAPMLRNNEVVGVIAFNRVEAGGFTDGEIALLRTFANQAAIAVDNARLLRDRGTQRRPA